MNGITREQTACLQKVVNPSADNTKVLVGNAGHLNLYGFYLENNHTADIYIQFFDKATTGAVTLGTTVADLTIRIPANGAVIYDPSRPCQHMGLGLVYAVTSTRTGSSAPGANASLQIFYSQQ